MLARRYKFAVRSAPEEVERLTDEVRHPLRGAGGGVLLASLIAAPIAFYFSVDPFSSNKDTSRDSGSLTSRASRLVASADNYNTIASSQNKLVATPPPALATKVAPVHPEAPLPTPVVAAPPPAPAVEQLSGAPAPSSAKARETDPKQIKLLMRQCEQFLAAGDVITARIVFQRVAETGNATAALALGATYDPDVLSKIGARVNPDIEKARIWYEKAKQFGSLEASRRLDELVGVTEIGGGLR